MAIIPMIPVGRVTTLNRSILLTERRMSGTGGDDFICGHCRHVMLEDFDPSKSAAIPCISAAFARTTMTYHSPPVVAIGLLGDEAEENQSATTRWSPPTATATGVPASVQSAKMRKGNAGFQLATHARRNPFKSTSRYCR